MPLANRGLHVQLTRRPHWQSTPTIPPTDSLANLGCPLPILEHDVLLCKLQLCDKSQGGPQEGKGLLLIQVVGLQKENIPGSRRKLPEKVVRWNYTRQLKGGYLSPTKQKNPIMPCCGSHSPATYFMLIRMFVGLLCEQIHFICLAKTHTQQISAQALGIPEAQCYPAKSMRKTLLPKYYSTLRGSIIQMSTITHQFQEATAQCLWKKKNQNKLQCSHSQTELTQHVPRCFSPKFASLAFKNSSL